MTTVTINVTTLAAREKIDRLAKAIGPGPILKVIGMRLLSYVDESFKTHGRGQWRPLAWSTVAMRRQGSSEPLQDTGRYKMSFVSETGGPGKDYETDGKTFVEVGSNVKTPSGLSLGKIHEFGTKPFVIEVKNAKVLAGKVGSGVSIFGLGGKHQKLGWLIFGTKVNHPGIPARPVLPTQATAERLVVETVTEMLDMEAKGTGNA